MKKSTQRLRNLLSLCKCFPNLRKPFDESIDNEFAEFAQTRLQGVTFIE